MHRLFLIIAVFTAMGIGMTKAADASKQDTVRCISTHKAINFYRQATHRWQMKMGVRITKASKQPITSCDYARWVSRLWVKRAHTQRLKYEKWHRAYLAHQKWLREMSDPWAAIRHVFGQYAAQAQVVASCESGHSVYAQNGQYLGLFQMGESERSKYGHGSTPLAQAKAAYRYFTASGFDWSPWQCKPW